MIKISIIVTFYNGNKYLNNLFEMFNKNYLNLKNKYSDSKLEVIIVNDSPEVNVEIPNNKIDFEYKLVTNEVNSGIHFSRVNGLNNSAGDYVLIFDQDDKLDDNFLLSQMNLLLTNNGDMVICNTIMETSGEPYLLYRKKVDYMQVNDLLYYLRSQNKVKSPGQVILKKDIIPKEWKDNIMKINGADDYFLWILLFEKGYKFLINKEALYTHTYTGSNISESNYKMNISTLELVKYLDKIDYVSTKNVYELKRSCETFNGLHDVGIFKKIIIVFKNLDLFIYLIIYRLKKYILG